MHPSPEPMEIIRNVLVGKPLHSVSFATDEIKTDITIPIAPTSFVNIPQ